MKKAYKVTYRYDMQVDHEETFTSKKEALEEFKYLKSRPNLYTYVELFKLTYIKIK